MQNFANTVLWIYIVLLVVGGMIGFLKGKSKVSLIMSVVFAALLILCAVGAVFKYYMADIFLAALAGGVRDAAGQNEKIHAFGHDVDPHNRHARATAYSFSIAHSDSITPPATVPETSLPIWEIHPQIVDSLRNGNRLILSAPTGSGKTTQVPQMLLQAGLLGEGQVVILQPRRLAARLLAARVAQELGVKLGREVGYQIRFENVTSRETKIRFVTEGVLLRQMIDDPELHGVSVVLFDEFHERHLYGDITLARALDVQESSRPDLKIAAMSATLDADLLLEYFCKTGSRGKETAASTGKDQSLLTSAATSPFRPRVLTSEGRYVSGGD